MASTDPQVPSKNPGASGSLGGVLGEVFRKQMQSVDVMLPAHVVSYDRVRNVAKIQPDIMLLTTEGEQVQRAPIAEVPVLALGGGGGVVSFPLKAGDRGWIEAADRDISLYIQALGRTNSDSTAGAKPNTLRMHNFSDSRFIPDVFGKYQLGAASEDSIYIGTIDGNTHIEINPSTQKITIRAAAGGVLFPAEATRVTFNCPVDFTKPVTMSDELTLKGIAMSTHKHQVVGVGQPTQGPQN